MASALAVWPKPTGWESARGWAWKAIPTELESLEDTAVSWTKSGDDPGGAGEQGTTQSSESSTSMEKVG